MIVEMTKAWLEAGLTVKPGTQRAEFCDSLVRGLIIEARAAKDAVPTFYLRHKVNGKTAYDRLGTIRDLTVPQARKLATQKKVAHSLAAKQAPALPTLGETTLDAFMQDHYFPHARIHTRSHQRADQLYRIRIAPKLGQVKLSAITRYQVQQFQNELAQEKLSPASQDHHIKLLRRVLNLAVQWEFLEKNVLKGIKLRMVENELHDVADDDQLLRLVEVLRTDENRPVCNILMYLLSTGARLNEALQATWSQVDVEKGLWTIPATTAKSKRSRSVPLNESAQYALAEAAKLKVSEYIFANPETGKPYTTITKVWYRLRKKAGISKMRIHSLRHQFASLLVSSGRSLYDVQVLLGHQDPRVSQRYARHSMQTLRDASSFGSVIVPKVEETAMPEAVQEAAIPEASALPPKEQPTDNVVQFTKAA